MKFLSFRCSFLLLALATLVVMHSGCASVLEEKSETAESLIQKARNYISVKNYSDAKVLLSRLLEDFPDSKERAEAVLLRSEIHYREKEYEEAKFRFGLFLEQYPAHPQADRALFLKAMCDFRTMEMELRDQTNTRNALEGFEKLIQTFPKSPYRVRAQQKIEKCLETLAKNQMEIGKFYFRTSAFQSAIARFKKIIETYPDHQFLDEAVFLLGECHYQEQNFKTAKDYYLKLLNDYPKSEYVKEARTRLRKIE